MITGVLTSKGVLGTDEYNDMTEVPCKCRGIAGSDNVEADWLLFICMSIVFKWAIQKPILLLLATCLHLRTVNKLAVKRAAGSPSGCTKLEDENNGTELSSVTDGSVYARPNSSFRVENPMALKHTAGGGAASKFPTQYDQDVSLNAPMAAEEEEADVWTIHMDDSSGFKYRYNYRTGVTEWCEYEEQEGDTIAEEDADEGDDAYGSMLYTENDRDPDHYGEERQASQEDMDCLAAARSRLQRVMQDQDTCGKGGHQTLVNDTRGDWAELCDDDGSVLGEQLRGQTVYFNKVTEETRITKPPGWVLLQAKALNRDRVNNSRRARQEADRQSRFQVSFRKAAPVHRKGSKVIGRQLKRFTSSAIVPHVSTRRLGHNASSSNTDRALSHHASADISEEAL